MHYLKIICLGILFLSCKKEIPRATILTKNYAAFYKEAKKYCTEKNLNKNQFILIDLGLHSGLKRFFIYNFKQKKITHSYMVSHGCGANSWSLTSSKEDAPISNEKDSHCSSIGKYIIGKQGVSQWGIKINYTLLGQDSTNSNAVSRAIVLHSWESVPENEVYPDGTPEGWGCPAVANESMKEIDQLLQKNKKMLLWIIKE